MVFAAIYALAMPLVASLAAVPEARAILASPLGAAWASAIGTVLATCVAIWLGLSESARHRKSIRDRHWALATLIGVCTKQAVEFLQVAQTSIEPTAVEVKKAESLDTILQTLAAAQLADAPDHELVDVTLIIRRNLQDVREAYGYIADAKSKGAIVKAGWIVEFNRAATVVRDQSKVLFSHIETMQARFNGE